MQPTRPPPSTPTPSTLGSLDDDDGAGSAITGTGGGGGLAVWILAVAIASGACALLPLLALLYGWSRVGRAKLGLWVRYHSHHTWTCCSVRFMSADEKARAAATLFGSKRNADVDATLVANAFADEEHAVACKDAMMTSPGEVTLNINTRPGLTPMTPRPSSPSLRSESSHVSVSLPSLSPGKRVGRAPPGMPPSGGSAYGTPSSSASTASTRATTGRGKMPPHPGDIGGFDLRPALELPAEERSPQALVEPDDDDNDDDDNDEDDNDDDDNDDDDDDEESLDLSMSLDDSEDEDNPAAEDGDGDGTKQPATALDTAAELAADESVYTEVKTSEPIKRARTLRV